MLRGSQKTWINAPLTTELAVEVMTETRGMAQRGILGFKVNPNKPAVNDVGGGSLAQVFWVKIKASSLFTD